MSDFLPPDGLDTLPDSPDASDGIVEDWMVGLPEWPNEHRTVERVYLGTLMQWKPDLAKPSIQVPDEWLSAFGVAARNALRAARPWPPFPSLYLISTLREQFKPEYVVDEVAAIATAALPWQALDDVAVQLRDLDVRRCRLERVRLRRRALQDMMDTCDVEELWDEKCKQLAALG